MPIRYKFLKKGLKSKSGNCKWKIGEQKVFKGDLNMCETGFHCSKTIYQAFSYVQGEILAEVEVKGKHKLEKDKEVWEKMTIKKAWKWQKKDSVALAIYSAELCLKNFEKVHPNDKRPRQAIEAAKKWLKGKITDEELSAAESVESAVWSAAWSAWSAARSAAKSAAWFAAWSVRYAAKSATESAESAAWSATWSVRYAARSAAESAAWSVRYVAWSARYAARSARSAVYKKIDKWMDSRLKKLEPYEKRKEN